MNSPSEPTFRPGDRVKLSFDPMQRGTGVVLGRAVNHERRFKNDYWRYEIRWESRDLTNHHFCCDLILL